MFVDRIKVKLKAGDGGDGSVSFLRDKFTMVGGPDGGDGGRGGNVIFVAKKNKNTLVDFYYQRKFFAENGENGSKKNCYGKNGKDLILEVPVGTIIRKAESEEMLCDLIHEDNQYKIVSGGAGGRGNSKFATSTRQSPGFSELGEKTKEYEIVLELKTIADVGLIGFPNVGKSTILSIISNARPKIANYHFTTLSPNLGVCKFFDNNFVVADIPGLIEGASSGAGLGHHFLRHIERTRLLVNVVDISEQDGRNYLSDIKVINNELALFSPKLTNLKQIIALNKCEIATDVEDKIKAIKKDKSIKQIGVYAVSGATRQGIDELLAAISNALKEIPVVDEEDFIAATILDTKDTTSLIIERDDKGVYVVTGGYVDNIARQIVFSDNESFAYFQKRLKDDGIIEAIKKHGAKEGSDVRFGDQNFTIVD